MARYRGPRVRLIRQLGPLPGLTNKITKRDTSPGEHGARSRRKRFSDYGIRLREKQKLRYNYGVSEKQLLKYVKEAKRVKGDTGVKILELLEMRLDVIVFRMGFASTIPAARQLVNHGHISVNGRRVDIASFQCCIGDIITPSSKKASQDLIKSVLEESSLNTAKHVAVNKDLCEGKVEGIVQRREVCVNVKELLIVEYYSRKVS